MAKTIYRLKGTIRTDSVIHILREISEDYFDLPFHIDMVKKDIKAQKEIQKGKKQRYPKNFGMTRHIRCYGEDLQKMISLHDKVEKYLIKDSSDKELL